LKEKRTMKDNVWRGEDEYLHYDLFLFTIIGATYMEEGVTEFSAWSKVMLAEKKQRGSASISSRGIRQLKNHAGKVSK
jgi:hypothetical protein